MRGQRHFLKKATSFFGRVEVLIGVYILITVIASLKEYFAGTTSISDSEALYTHYNNYVIFKNSFWHLLYQKDLYQWYLEEQWDLFKYSPTFALLMGFFAMLPDWLGLILWNLLNSLLLLGAILKLPVANNKMKVAIGWFVLLELLTSMQNSQSNALMAALIIWAVNFMERDKMIWATLMIVLSVYIKLFGVLGFLLCWFYPNKLKSFLYSLCWAVVLFFLPLLVTPFSLLIDLYESWGNLLQNDHGASLGLSVMGWFSAWFGWTPPKIGVVLTGAVILLLALLRYRCYQFTLFRIFMLASVLLWMVVFNHKAESPTFIIAMAGVGIWYYSQRKNTFNLMLVVLAFVFTSLSPTDLFPDILQRSVFDVYVVKVVFCIFIWCKITYDLLTKNFKNYVLEYSREVF